MPAERVVKQAGSEFGPQNVCDRLVETCLADFSAFHQRNQMLGEALAAHLDITSGANSHSLEDIRVQYK